MTKTEEIRPHQRTCPLCEGMCGIDVSVDGDQVTMVRPNKANVWSRGHICPKGTTLGDLHHDPDRLRTPMIREGTQWRAASWEEAFAHADRLARGVREKYGQSAFASFGGNMSGKGFASGRYMMLLYRLARFAQSYSSSSVDQLPKNVSSFLLYGNMWRIPIPDIDRTDLFVILGANPAESKGSIFSHRDVMGGIRDLRARGGRVVVLDPVRTRTAAAADQWVPLRPGSDAALLLGIVHVLFAENRVRLGHLSPLLSGVETLRDVAAAFPPERVADFCGVDASVIRRLALDIADARAAAIYGRIGTCTQSFGTLASWLVDAIAILTGNLDAPGGSMWSTQVAPHLDLAPPYASTGAVAGNPSRVRGVPAILGQYPASCLAEEIDTPGEGQIHALMTLGANPVLSVPGSARLDAALEQLDCMVSIDIYLNETTRHAHVIFPSPSLLEQPHWDIWAWPWALTSGGHYSPALFGEGHRPPEWQVMARIGAIMGGVDIPDLNALDDEFFGMMCDQAGVDRQVAFAALPTNGPERILDLCIRSGPFGDRFGAHPTGLSLADFKTAPDGILLGPAVPLGERAITTPTGRIELAHPHFLTDIPRLEAALDEPVPALVLVSRRQLRSLNSWMHNLNTLVKGKERCTLQIHGDDARALGLAHGDSCEVTSQGGIVTAPVEVTDDIMPGVVSLPHGWGHDREGARLDIARLHVGTNINELSPAEMIDAASGNAVLNGIPVAVRRLP
ncbi:molybdopterin-dependent oxidoreductase [Sphingobium cupriresistens]|uniref:Molybdopterin dinucleotide-binding protein n=1 Tax=Sphingobium cupriresistens LL01 TaxID=1420583 RepID=A0A0J7XZF7_9SPHN|nr:molybdopterin-dependent oxidoreductase [Sphingobium cupriresistens]KMS57041.1 molybdopterin dinucleotide-binding protein [Sphingobium cupriresistens LL01]